MNALRDLANYAINLLPTSKCYAFKRLVLRMAGINVCADAKINGHTWFYGRGKVTIGDRTWIGPGCRFYSTFGTTIEIGKDCDIAPEVSFVTGSHEFGTSARRAGPGFSKDIHVEDGTWLGARVTVLGGVVVGSGSFVAAGGMVNANLPSNCLAAGIPAKVKRSFEA